jgi:hypothetical protein
LRHAGRLVPEAVLVAQAAHADRLDTDKRGRAHHVPLILGLLLAIALPVFDYVSARKVYAVSVIGTVILLAPIILVPLLHESSVATAWLGWLGNVP